MRIDNPHESTHVPGTVNVVANVNCTKPMAAINMTVDLYDYNRDRLAAKPFASYGSASLRGNASLSCRPGNYDGTADIKLTFPPGYTPSPTYDYIGSPIVYIDCV